MNTSHRDAEGDGTPASQADIQEIRQAALRRINYCAYLTGLSVHAELDPEFWAAVVAAELRHIVTTNLTGAE